MQNYSKYYVVKCLDIISLEEEVNKLITEGWSLYGDLKTLSTTYCHKDSDDICHGTGGTMSIYYQAMVK